LQEGSHPHQKGRPTKKKDAASLNALGPQIPLATSDSAKTKQFPGISDRPIPVVLIYGTRTERLFFMEWNRDERISSRRF